MGCGFVGVAAAIGAIGWGWDGAGNANRSESASVGTETAGSLAYAIGVAGCELTPQGAAVWAVGAALELNGALPVGAFQASVFPVADRAAALSYAVRLLAGGAVALCITGSGSP